jgi:hypothetical protein
MMPKVKVNKRHMIMFEGSSIRHYASVKPTTIDTIHARRKKKQKKKANINKLPQQKPEKGRNRFVTSAKQEKGPEKKPLHPSPPKERWRATPTHSYFPSFSPNGYPDFPPFCYRSDK